MTTHNLWTVTWLTDQAPPHIAHTYQISPSAYQLASERKRRLSQLTRSTSQTSKVPSLEPVASLVPSGENLQNHTSSQWSLSTCVVKQGNWSLQHKTSLVEKVENREKNGLCNTKQAWSKKLKTETKQTQHFNKSAKKDETQYDNIR